MCECNTCVSVEKQILICLIIYSKYKWIVDSYVLDFYVNNYWSQLSNTWKTFLEHISISDIGVLLDIKCPLNKLTNVCPLSILALRELFKIINLSRNQICTENIYINSNKHIICEQIEKNNVLDNDNISYNDEGTLLKHPNLKNFLWKHISPKKKHEILSITKICATVGRHCNCNIILDFGSGLGHLARILTFGFDFKLYCIEAQQSLSAKAKKLDNELEMKVHKYMSLNESRKYVKPVHINVRINNTDDLRNIIQQIKDIEKTDNLEIGIVGLHPCGDLAALLLRFFMNNPNVKFLNLASCCYMKLSTQSVLSGYPLSNFLKFEKSNLSYESRELACHAIELYTEKLHSNNYSELHIHAFRATIEKIIVKYWPERKHSGLKNVKYTADLTFDQYCSKALKGMDISIPHCDIESQDTIKNLAEWRKVVVFYSLRLMFAPLIETIILLDRFLFISESDIESRLVPILNSKLSPRCHILIANKIRNKT